MINPLLLALAAGAGAVQANPDSVRVVAVARAIVAADNARDLAGVLRCYAPDAMLLPPNEAPVSGPGAIRPRYEALFAAYDPAIEPVLEEVVVSGDMAVVRGRNGGLLKGRNGRPDKTLADVYVMVLRRGADGSWRITRLIWHPGVPARP